MTAVREHALDEGLPPAWACEWGRDRYGVFAGFAVGRVVQRLRWIPPGTFLMGSPDTEAGRWGDEGPQHAVTIPRGFWLADTPCTQALWEVVMGANPSKFPDPARPVEQVSWDDCGVFLKKLRALIPGPAPRLPTEAEWEYACRAGTTAATWAGDLTLREDGALAPELHAIACYVGNSGDQYDLEHGTATSRAARAGTRRVRTREPNPWGLYDLLGNVWEWCSDLSGRYAGDPSVDPRGPDAGTGRVLRGGSWNYHAGLVRAAARFAGVPGNRRPDFGFRLARGHQV